MHSDPVCSQVSLPSLALSAVGLLAGPGAGDVLRAAVCSPSFLHSCEPPIIHGNLTSDTIFIQHNGLIKIGSGRKLLAEGRGGVVWGGGPRGFQLGRRGCRVPEGITRARLGVTFSSLCVLCSMPSYSSASASAPTGSLAQGVCKW